MSCENGEHESPSTRPPEPTSELFQRVYAELRGIADAIMRQERSDHTLSATALVNEAYVRLESQQQEHLWSCPAHFFTAAAEAMRRILIDRARAKTTLKRHGKRQRIDLDQLQVQEVERATLLLEVDELLEVLSQEDPQAAKFVKLRLFAGKNVTEAGELLGMTRWSAYRMWDFAQAWFSLKSAEASS